MGPQATPVTAESPIGDAEQAPLVTAHESAPNWLVLTEDGNTDGWIATDLTVDVGDYR